jgi:hypothetical protein
MDGDRFDTLARTLSMPTARRGTLRLLVGLTLGRMVATSSAVTEAKSRGKSKGKRKHKRKPKPAPSPTPPVALSRCPPGEIECPEGCCPGALPQCCPAGLNGAPGCCPGNSLCCPGRLDTSSGGKVACCVTGGCCTSSDGCPQGQRCDDLGCCKPDCNQPNQICNDQCCNDGFICVTTFSGGDELCCLESQACPGSQTGCCSGENLRCQERVNPPAGTPTHVCVTT